MIDEANPSKRVLTKSGSRDVKRSLESGGIQRFLECGKSRVLGGGGSLEEGERKEIGGKVLMSWEKGNKERDIVRRQMKFEKWRNPKVFRRRQVKGLWRVLGGLWRARKAREGGKKSNEGRQGEKFRKRRNPKVLKMRQIKGLESVFGGRKVGGEREGVSMLWERGNKESSDEERDGE